MDVNVKIYIPIDLEDCITQLQTSVLCDEDREAIKKGTEDNLCLWHDNLGRWIRNNWGLWTDSDLFKWFKEKGIDHPDDMSGIILTSFWRRLHDKPLNLEEQIQKYQNYWKEEAKCQKTIIISKN